ncbi:MAG: tellurium resistance protein TerC [Deltaproteobacteria bacterium]|nr:tellurium resistance protein TerC [Deltaproteobacteria bacterium]MBU49617.1 tellurium resistance protein TerC [Deltaproteobacteria bacterium]|tara:strand:- start:12340 stop:13149 length:810 start_codon:yes stop_codon:yes gene_type:complete
MFGDFAALFTVSGLFTLFMLILLQAVLGFDNLLYISLESKRAPAEEQQRVRRLGIGIAIGLRLVLLFVLLQAVSYFQGKLFSIDFGNAAQGTFNGHSLIVLFGGGFILYTAVKEILHMAASQEFGEHENKDKKSAAEVITWIVVMNLIFSFDSILSAMALTKNFWVMATAIVVSGIMMIVLADTVSNFLKKNRMYEVLGLFILFVVGVMLISEGGHLAHLKFFGHPVEPMTKSTFYFVIGILIVIDIVQGRYQKKLLAEKSATNKKIKK